MEIPEYEKNYLRNLDLGTDSPVIYDVGANMGDWAKIALEIWPKAEIYCFEPNFECLEYLKEYPQLNIINIALSTTKGEAQLYYSGGGPDLGASLYFPHPFHRFEKYFPHSWTVKTDLLKNYIEEYYTIDLLKIDAEGSELDILKSAEDKLNPTNVKNIEFEFAGWSLTTGNQFKVFWEYLNDLGYNKWKELSEDRNLYSYDSKYEEDNPHKMFYFSVTS